jgi:hypothetical protein
MTFEEWADNYFGPNVNVPAACKDAWRESLIEAAKWFSTREEGKDFALPEDELIRMAKEYENE